MQTNEPIAAMGLVARTTITFSGSGSDWPWMDSFDSSNPAYSSNGQYDPVKRKDTVFAASLSSAPGCINTGSGEIWGSAATAPGGTVIGNVGDGAWLTTTLGIQPGHVRDDFDFAIPDAILPPVTWQAVPTNRTLVNDNYKLTGDLTSSIVAVGKARLWVAGDVKLTGGNVSINPGGSLEMFISGFAAFSGNGIVNASGSAANCVIWGLPTCTSVKYFGRADFIGRIYAPQADVMFGSNLQAFGAFTANSFSFSGATAIHCDDALAR